MGHYYQSPHMATTTAGVEPREIKIIKVAREKPPSAWNAQHLFENLDVNALGLDLLEVKAKLKSSPPALKSSLPTKTNTKPPVIPKPKSSPKVIVSPRESPSASYRSMKGATEDSMAKAFAAGSQEEFSEGSEIGSESEVKSSLGSNSLKSSTEKQSRSASQSRSRSRSISASSSEDFGELSGSGANEEIGEALKEPETIVEAEPEETEADKKRKIIRRLRTLRKINPNLNIPTEDFTLEDDLELMQNTLDEVVQDIKVDQNLTIYKTFMQGYFVGTEFLAGMLEIDMIGFAAAQMKQIRRYDSLLLELAEKNSGGWAANLPVELRLLGLVMINTAVYFAFRYIYNRKGSAQANAFMGVYDSLPSFDGSSTGNSGTPAATGGVPTPEPPKVKGPSVNLKDIEDQLGSTSDDDDGDVDEVELDDEDESE